MQFFFLPINLNRIKAYCCFALLASDYTALVTAFHIFIMNMGTAFVPHSVLPMSEKYSYELLVESKNLATVHTKVRFMCSVPPEV